MELLISILVTVIVFVLALYRVGYKNGYIDGFKFGKEDAEREYHKLIEEYQERDRRINYYQ